MTCILKLYNLCVYVNSWYEYSNFLFFKESSLSLSSREGAHRRSGWLPSDDSILPSHRGEVISRASLLKESHTRVSPPDGKSDGKWPPCLAARCPASHLACPQRVSGDLVLMTHCISWNHLRWTASLKNMGLERTSSKPRVWIKSFRTTNAKRGQAGHLHLAWQDVKPVLAAWLSG